MTTIIGHGTYVAVLTVDDSDGFACKTEGKIATLGRELAGGANEYPLLVKDLFGF